ncbi:MAG TPA: bifunctional nuclease family protein [Actinomycetota bacterium]|jgi:bifunctional DNase/RNase|nr:bifunctional nuclease family protein [Actinomycetota bacterium]HYG71582.1 bifunctional nuclease family protein [Actinomycetota bacterium]
MIEMTLAGVRIELPTQSPIVLLREQGGDRYLPIWIGSSEAQAIAIGLQGVVMPRPMTHDLMKNILDEVAVQVDSISITELREGTFYATINLHRNGSSYEVSSRPSDAIALAVRLGCKIFANEDVVSEAGILIPNEGEEEEEVEKFREFLESVNPEDFQ